MADLHDMVVAERRMLHIDLQNLSDEQWSATTVCDPWAVRQLVAHLTALGHQSFPNFAKNMITNGFSFDKAIAADIPKYDKGSNADVLDAYAATVETTNTPPGPKYVTLGETMVHGEDIRRATGTIGDHPPEHLATLAEMLKTTGAPFNAKKRIDGLKLTATDADWTTGSGPEVSGPGMELIRAMTGRNDGLDRCTGDGVDVLRSR